MALEKRPSSNASQKKIRLLAFLRRVALAFLALAVVGAIGYWFFVGWRARDLALKARTNLENANYRFAWLQATSARELRADEPEVRRTSAIVDAAFGRKESLEAWQSWRNGKP